MTRKKQASAQPQARQYIVTVPNIEYDGKTYGVQFYQGKALIAEHTIDSRLGWTVDEIARKLKADFSYEVEEVMA